MKHVCCITGNQWITGSEMIYIEKLLEQDANLGLCVCWEVLDILCVFFYEFTRKLGAVLFVTFSQTKFDR